jgi:hypothetical protein
MVARPTGLPAPFVLCLFLGLEFFDQPNLLPDDAIDNEMFNRTSHS